MPHDEIPGGLNPMIPLLFGWLWGTLEGRGRKDMRIVDIRPDPDFSRSELLLRFESGLVLRIIIGEERGRGDDWSAGW